MVIENLFKSVTTLSTQYRNTFAGLACLMVLDIDTSNSDGTSINVWNVLTDQSYFEPFATLWTFTDPVLNFFTREFWMGQTPPVATSLSQLTTTLDLFVFGPNEMNGNESVEFMPHAPKYSIVGDILDSIKPENQKEWLESFTFEASTFVEYPALIHQKNLVMII